MTIEVQRVRLTEFGLTCTLCRSWKRTAMLTGWSSPRTVVDMTEEPRTVPRYLVMFTDSDISTLDTWSNLITRTC